MGVRELIEGKQRRTANLPILVGNPSAAAAAVESARRTLALHEETLKRKPAGKKPTAAERKKSEQLRADMSAAVDAFKNITVVVELQSLPPDEWESLFNSLEQDDDGNVDLHSIHPTLLAASCTDPELQDVEWWTEQLAREEWTAGDRAGISMTFFELNTYGPRFGALGKG